MIFQVINSIPPSVATYTKITNTSRPIANAVIDLSADNKIALYSIQYSTILSSLPVEIRVCEMASSRAGIVEDTKEILAIVIPYARAAADDLFEFRYSPHDTG